MKQSGAKLLLTTVFIARGSSFLFSKSLMGTMSPMSILAVRFILAFLVLAVVFWRRIAHEGLTMAKGAGYIVILLALLIYNRGSKSAL